MTETLFPPLADGMEPGLVTSVAGARGCRQASLGNNAKLSGRTFEAVDAETGEIFRPQREPKPSRLEQVALAYRRKRGLDRLVQLLPKREDGQPHRCFKCHRYALPGGKVAAMYSEQYQKAFIAGTEVCANQWLCPLCMRKITKRKGEEVEQAARLAIDGHGLRALLITLDFRHDNTDKLDELLTMLTGKGSAFDLMKKDDRSFAKLKAELGWFGHITALEITRGEIHGWHPHLHLLVFIENDEITAQEVQQRLSPAWANACAKVGRFAHLEHGCNVQEGDDATYYIAKMAAEVAAGSTKNGRAKGRTYPQILDGAIAGNKQDIALFVEFALATKGRNALRWSPGLRAKLGMGRELTNEELAAETDDASARLFSLISHRGWNLIYDRDLVAHLCHLIETDPDQARAFIAEIENPQLKEEPTKMKYAYFVDTLSKHAKGYFIRCDAAKIRDGLSMHAGAPKSRVAVDETVSPPRWTAGGDVFDQYSEKDFHAGLIPGVRRNQPFYCFSEAPKRVNVRQFKNAQP